MSCLGCVKFPDLFGKVYNFWIVPKVLKALLDIKWIKQSQKKSSIKRHVPPLQYLLNTWKNSKYPQQWNSSVFPLHISYRKQNQFWCQNQSSTNSLTATRLHTCNKAVLLIDSKSTIQGIAANNQPNSMKETRALIRYLEPRECCLFDC